MNRSVIVLCCVYSALGACKHPQGTVALAPTGSTANELRQPRNATFLCSGSVTGAPPSPSLHWSVYWVPQPVGEVVTLYDRELGPHSEGNQGNIWRFPSDTPVRVLEVSPTSRRLFQDCPSPPASASTLIVISGSSGQAAASPLPPNPPPNPPPSSNVFVLGVQREIQRNATYQLQGENLSLTVVSSEMAHGSDSAGHDFENVMITLRVTHQNTTETLSLMGGVARPWHGFIFRAESLGFAWSGAGAGSLTITRQ